ncbi:MAG: DUF99 domain-containing protein [Methanomicrobiales archaeon HGW-Methanomicrobiales-1]|jgi:hypothetical protein|nr:MAG: DUF99 domain-containing protein [Methanomicrobiales archaeon HGW-Methanomicrobiales-1]
MHIPKKGLRALGIAESFSGRTCSTLAGVVMRKDLRIDGFAFGNVTVGGMDATDRILGMVKDLDRSDINVIMLSGCVIAWFNVIDPARIALDTGIPVICVTYEDSDGLEADIRYHFPDDEERITAYRKLGERVPVKIHTHQTIFLRAWGLSQNDAEQLCKDFTLEGKIPEPLRVARLCSRHLVNYRMGNHLSN